MGRIRKFYGSTARYLRRNWWRCFFIVMGTLTVAGFIEDGAQIIDILDLHEGLAAWVQAFGVFAAVLMAGELARRQSATQERERQERLVSSAQAVVAKAASAIRELEESFLFSNAGELGRHSIEMLRAVHGALTPKRIHDLPDFVLVTSAVDVVTGLSEILQWFRKNPDIFTPGFFAKKPFEMPKTLGHLYQRTIADCDAFTICAEQWMGRR